MARWSPFSRFGVTVRRRAFPARTALRPVPPSALEIHHLLHPPLMPAPLKGGFEEHPDDVPRDLAPRDPLPQGDRVGIVVCPGQPGGRAVVAERAADTRH